MQRKTIVFVLIISIIAGCSVAKRQTVKERYRTEEAYVKDLIELVRSNNISNYDFYLQKADFEITEKDFKYKISGSLKYRKPDTLLLTLRSLIGLEVARIYVTSDTILVNDRINKIVMFGNQNDLEKKVGFNIQIFFLLLGDFISHYIADEAIAKCSEGFYETEYNIKNGTVKYYIDCKRNKTFSAVVQSEKKIQNISIRYANYRRADKIIIPTKIELDMPDDKIKLTIIFDVKKMNVDWTGKVEFVPGNRYELRRIR